MRVLLLFLFFISCHVLHAQQNTAMPKADTIKKEKSIMVLKLDSSKTDLRNFDQQALQKYRDKKEFQYDDNPQKTKSAWDKFWESFWKWFQNLFRSEKSAKQSPILGVVLKYSLIALSAGLIIFVVFKLLKVDFKLFFGKSKLVDVPYDESLENIHEIDFDEQLDTALQNNNYRLSVRLLYLQTLKRLSDKELIDWQTDKTNSAYVKELENESLHADFSSLTYQFEYIWYGDFYIDKIGFSQVKQSFHNFNQALL